MLTLLLGVACATAGCEGDANFVNTGPTDVTMTRDRCYIWTGGTVKFAASAADADGDPLTFSWTATKGTFNPPSATGTSISWIAPNDPGVATITMRVTDELETVTKTADVIVGMTLPSIISTMTLRDLGYVYILKGAVPAEIPQGSIVTIEPGVEIIVDSKGGGLSVGGTLLAHGAPANRVKFQGNTFSGGTGFWSGIFADGIGSRIEFENVEVANGTDGIQCNNEAQISLDGCTIYDNSSAGVTATDQAVLTVTNSDCTQNGTGVYIRNAIASLSRSSIVDNRGNGIELSASPHSSAISIDSCVIADNTGSGIVLINGADPEIHYCSIFNTQPTAGTYCVRLLTYVSDDTVHAENNFWGVNVDSAEEIGRIIYDKTDNPMQIMGLVAFEPWLMTAPTRTDAR